jgi:uncharacterized integral membrane protein
MADERSRADHHQRGRHEGRGTRFYVIWVLIGLALIFVLQNTDDTNVKFLFAETSLPLFFALLIALALGAAIGYLAPRVHRDRHAERDRK